MFRGFFIRKSSKVECAVILYKEAIITRNMPLVFTTLRSTI